MSVQSEITRISSNVTAALAAVSAKGGIPTAGATSDDLAAAIATIPSGYSWVRYEKYTLDSDITTNSLTDILTNYDFLTQHYNDPNLCVAVVLNETPITKDNYYTFLMATGKALSANNEYGVYEYRKSYAASRYGQLYTIFETTHSVNGGLYVREAGKLQVSCTANTRLLAGTYDIVMWIRGGGASQS